MSKEKIIFDDSKIIDFYEKLRKKELEEINEQMKKIEEE